MKFSEEILIGLGSAFNEADLLGAEFDSEKKLVVCTLNRIVVDENGNVPSDRRIQLILKSVSRIVSSLRNSSWDNDFQKAEKLEPDELLKTVQSFGGCPIYGWEFINCGQADYDRWKNRLSFDWKSNEYSGSENTFDLFQEGNDRHLDIRIWFDELIVFDPNGNRITFEKLIEEGNRGWNAINSKPDISNQFGIYPIDD